MLLGEFSQLYERELNKLKNEISSYNPETKLWIIKSEIKNSAGNLCLHITGGLLYFIGNVLGKTEYMRNRDGEFSERNVAKRELLITIEDTKNFVVKTLNSLDESALKNKYPVELSKKDMTTGYFLIHLYGHLNYHLGQINYHRRLIDEV